MEQDKFRPFQKRNDVLGLFYWLYILIINIDYKKGA